MDFGAMFAAITVEVNYVRNGQFSRRQHTLDMAANYRVEDLIFDIEQDATNDHNNPFFGLGNFRARIFTPHGARVQAGAAIHHGDRFYAHAEPT